ncbi:MAG: hypothetical protein A2X28_08935 [Elusimicrobia bacterium GWA2_56_46]|nr:MAG: hypothetical protein A2X28_08935 [Elusimicrobia bacterium GWA2_56_46]OGR54429.1 MAG: hypothetical protein A2X39_04015 [Elusimicrobia bacterium GWC2_56_31]HBB67033.1 hypothetical protein [Elusimicrobiota bacterium]HBW22593.1 hypothetical protein [Elusimicrobiota bacterium]
MRKIKKFKIPIYTYEILRKAKKRRIDLFALGLADQESAREYISSLAAALEPSTVFDLIAPEDALAKESGLQGMTGTLGVMTLGTAFETKLKAITDPELFRLAETAALVFSETGLKVITELIAQEVTAEGLDLGKPNYLFACPEPETEEPPSVRSDAAVLAACLGRLNADKIGISLNESVLSPAYSFIFSLPWLAKKKLSAKK